MSRKTKRAPSLYGSSSLSSSASLSPSHLTATTQETLRPLPPPLDQQQHPRLDVQVYHVPGGAIARSSRHQPPPPARHQQPQQQVSPTQTLDALVRGVWSIAIACGEAGGWYEERWRRGDFRPEDLLDALILLEQEDAFPYPSSPRYDGVGGAGGASIAADGSPGVPIAWVRYIDRADVADGVKKADAFDTNAAGRRIVAQAQDWIARTHPEAWAIYRDHVLGRQSFTEIARRRELSYRQVQRRCARARALLLAQIAFATGEATVEEYASVLATATAAHENATTAIS